jgi:hypothetical protein
MPPRPARRRPGPLCRVLDSGVQPDWHDTPHGISDGLPLLAVIRCRQRTAYPTALFVLSLRSEKIGWVSIELRVGDVIGPSTLSHNTTVRPSASTERIVLRRSSSLCDHCEDSTLGPAPGSRCRRRADPRLSQPRACRSGAVASALRCCRAGTERASPRARWPGSPAHRRESRQGVRFRGGCELPRRPRW